MVPKPTPADDPEQRARRQVDAMLVASGWAVQDRAATNLAAAPGIAVREFRTEAGPSGRSILVDPLPALMRKTRA